MLVLSRKANKDHDILKIFFKNLNNIHKQLNTPYMPHAIKTKSLLFTEYKSKDAIQGLILLLSENYFAHK